MAVVFVLLWWLLVILLRRPRSIRVVGVSVRVIRVLVIDARVRPVRRVLLGVLGIILVRRVRPIGIVLVGCDVRTGAGRAVLVHRGVVIVAGERIRPVAVGASGAGGYHALAMELSRMSRGSNGRAAVIFRGQHAAITAGRLFVLCLHRSGHDVVVVLGGEFR